MSLKAKMSKLFSKAEPSDQLGIAFRQNALAFCYKPKQGQYKYHQIPFNNDEYQAAIVQLIEAENIQAQGHLILAPNQYKIVQVDKPNVPEEEIISALKWQIKELVTFTPDDMILDYFSSPTLSGGSEKINVVCAQKSQLKPMVDQFGKSDISLKTITTEEFAFASLVPFQEQAVMLICQQPNEEIVILIVKHSRLYFHRRLRGYTQISTQSIEECSVVVDSLSLEIQRSLDYFERQLKQAPIKNIQVILPIKTMNYLVSKLDENINIAVVAYQFEQQHQDKSMFAAAIGATQIMPVEVDVND